MSNEENFEILDENAWDSCDPKSEYHKIYEGLNYHRIDSVFCRVRMTGTNGSFERMLCESVFLRSADETGRQTLYSPPEPIESKLSLPKSVGKRIRKLCESLQLDFNSLIGNILVIYRVGTTKDDTKYPKVDIMSMEEYRDLYGEKKKK